MSKSADEADNSTNQCVIDSSPDSNNNTNELQSGESQLQILPENETDNYDVNSPMLQHHTTPVSRHKLKETRLQLSDSDEKTPMTKNEMFMSRKRQLQNKRHILRKSESENELEVSPRAAASASSSETLDTKVKKIKKLHFRNLQNEISIQNHNVYIELEELEYIDEDVEQTSVTLSDAHYQWNILYRWIKYEQRYDYETSMWSKPYIGALIYQNLIYLRNTLQYSTIILNSPKNSVETIMDEIIQEFIGRGHMNRDHKQKLKNILLSSRRHHLTVASALTRKKTMPELFSSNTRRRFSRTNSFVADLGSSTSQFRKTSSYHLINMGRTPRGDEMQSLSTMNLEEKDRDTGIKFFVAGADDSFDNSTNYPAQSRYGASASIMNLLKLKPLHTNKSLKSMQSAMDDIEAFLIMVGAVDFLDRPVMAFVRMTDNCVDHLAEYQLKIRFIFVFMGPKREDIDYLEIGRCIGTLMTKKEFHYSAYNAINRNEIVKSITEFVNKSLCVVLPLGSFDKDLMVPMLDWVKAKMQRKYDKLNHRKKGISSEDDMSALNFMAKSHTKRKDLHLMRDNFEEKDESVRAIHGSEGHDDPFKRTGTCFGGLRNELKKRYSHYWSDIKDGFNVHCLLAFVSIFTVCIVPALSFGGILAEKTHYWFGVDEMLIATSLNGIVFGLFSGQPLMIFGATGPFLIFEEMLFDFCVERFCIEFLALRCWVALWVLVFTLIMVASEGIFLINYVTRFTEEIFAILIACVFLTDAFKKIIKYFVKNPVKNWEGYCNSTSPFLADITPHHMSNHTVPRFTADDRGCAIYRNLVNATGDYHADSSGGQPNVALLSMFLLIGTCTIALALKKLRRSKFFGSYLRRTLCDVGILISIVLMVSLDMLIYKKTDIKIHKLNIPEDIVPQKFNLRKSWIVSPFGNNYIGYKDDFPMWVPLVAIFPAALLFIILFFEVELTEVMLSAKHRKLKKGNGFNIDLLLGAIMMTFNSFFGLPWLCTAPVRTLAHWASLSVYSSSHIPGVKPKLVKVNEQRLTNILVHLAIGLCLFAKDVLQLVSVPILFGIILYFGIVSLSGTQLFERIKLIFIPFKYCPNMAYARGVHPFKRNLFTIIQLMAVLLLLGFKSFISVSYVFPIMLVLLVPFRRFVLPKLFTLRELEQLDDESEPQEDSDMVLDFYEQTHMPI